MNFRSETLSGLSPQMREAPKLPQARMYLKSAKCGFQMLLSEKPDGYKYRFFIIGVLAALRAVQHALKNHDATISAEHNKVISEWWNATRNKEIPQLNFIRTARNQILKAGSFESYAISGESSVGEGANYTVTDTRYEIAYYDDAGSRKDLAVEIQSALDWCDTELAKIEKLLPSRHKAE